MNDDDEQKPLVSEIDGEVTNSNTLSNYKETAKVELSSTRRKLNLTVALISIFLSNTGFALISPSLWIYLQKVSETHNY